MSDSRSVATRSILHVNARRVAPLHVDMIGSDSRSGDKFNLCVGEQFGVATSASANNHRIGISDSLSAKLVGMKVSDFSVGFKASFDERNFVFDDNQRSVKHIA